jgi:WXG100 family type VII secretion target
VPDTSADAQVMERTAQQFESSNADLQQMLSNLLNELEALRSGWKGRGFEQFETVKVRYRDDQQALQKTLGETANAIRTAGRQYTSTDTSAADRIGGAHRGQNLPL